MTAAEDETRVRAERARAVALFRYQLVREAADAALSTRQRGAFVRVVAGREHAGPFGNPVRVSRQTLDRWIVAWRRGGFDALVPSKRQVTARTPAEVLDLAAGLKRENLERTAAQVTRILRTHLGWAPSESTVTRLFTRLELSGPVRATTPVFGRFEASRPNEMWTGDALHGSAFVDRWLLRACAILGIRLTHSTPGRPQGRGKIERFFETTRSQFLVEVTGTSEPGRHQVEDLDEMNRLFHVVPA
jgi:putative transposase